MESLCSTCFCSGRNLYSIAGTGLFNVYEQILNEISVKDLQFKLSMLICWECKALLKKFQHFRVQVQTCYLELLECLHQDSSNHPAARSPHLKIHEAYTISYPLVCPDLIKEEPLDLLPEKEEVHNEPETFVRQLGFESEVKEDAERVEADKHVARRCEKDERKQEHKKKVKKKVKLKTKSKKNALKRIEPPLSDGISDRENDGESLDDQCGLETVADEEEDTKILKDLESRPKVQRRPRSKEVLPEKPTCAECGKTFSSRKTYRYHRNVLHKGQNRYPCPRCGRVYQWKSNLGRHMRTHKARDTGELHCETCDKSFASVATYRQHLKISRRHVPESDYRFMCNECGKKFVDKTRLRDHIDWEHLKIVKYRCHICNNVKLRRQASREQEDSSEPGNAGNFRRIPGLFNSSTRYPPLSVTRDQSVPHKCSDYIEHAFKCNTTLYVHMQNIHTNKEKKDNLCHVCGKSYQNASKLKYHIVAMHTSETPHRCADCGAAFGWYSSLYRHVREVHYGMKVPARNVKKSKKLLRELLLQAEENPALPSGPP